MNEKGVPGLLLDRDGVIIRNRSDYVLQLEDVEFIPGSIEAIVRASKLERPIVLITNQSAIGRGLLAKQTADEINQLVSERITDAGGRVDAIYMCPHSPKHHCSCRKPKPGMIEQAARDFTLDLSQSILIGDAITDIQAGRRAGVGTLAMVRTGRGAEQEKRLTEADSGGLLVYDQLNQALLNLLP